MIKINKGFTLIELLVVIVLLAILSAVFLPKMINFSTKAREAVIEHIAGTVQETSELAHYYSILENHPNNIRVEGVQIQMQNGYPSRVGIVKLIDMRKVFSKNIGHNKVAFYLDALKNNNHCRVVYKEATNNNKPEISVDTSNCSL